MGTIVEFPLEAAARRTNAGMYMAARETSATILILPSIRIERHVENMNGDSDPQQRTAPAKRRKRRARS